MAINQNILIFHDVICCSVQHGCLFVYRLLIDVVIVVDSLFVLCVFFWHARIFEPQTHASSQSFWVTHSYTVRVTKRGFCVVCCFALVSSSCL